MYLSKLCIKNFRCFDTGGISLDLQRGLTAFVGENDAGKSAIKAALLFLPRGGASKTALLGWPQ